jgi:hypothetical protein
VMAGRAQLVEPLADTIEPPPAASAVALTGHDRRIAWLHVPKTGTSFATTLFHYANASLPEDAMADMGGTTTCSSTGGCDPTRPLTPCTPCDTLFCTARSRCVAVTSVSRRELSL